MYDRGFCYWGLSAEFLHLLLYAFVESGFLLVFSVVRDVRYVQTVLFIAIENRFGYIDNCLGVFPIDLPQPIFIVDFQGLLLFPELFFQILQPPVILLPQLLLFSLNIRLLPDHGHGLMPRLHNFAQGRAP